MQGDFLIGGNFMQYKHKKALTEKARELRKNMTKEERKLWYDFLSGYPVRFLRQKVIGNYIVDFYCARAKLVIELDGAQHYEEAARVYDQKRTEFLQEYGITVVRILNAEILRNFYGVCEYIDGIVKDRLQYGSNPP